MKRALFAPVLLLIAISSAPAQIGGPIVYLRVPTRECCREELRKLKAAIGDPRLDGIPVVVKVLQTSESKRGSATAFTVVSMTIPGGYDIYVTKRLPRILNHEKFLAVLAHELGHLVNPENKFNDLNSEFFADDFSMAALRKMDIDPRLALSALEKIFRTSVFASREDIIMMQKRIIRMKAILSNSDE